VVAPAQGLTSVILPNRNHARYLPIALDALLAQTWKEFEVLVIDDASSDDSYNVILEYAARDPRIRPFQLSEHSGAYRAVEFAMPSARGEYLYLAAADDFISPTFFEKSIYQLRNHPSAGLCFSDPAEVREREERIISFPLYLSSYPIHYDPSLFRMLLKRNYFHISANTVLYRIDAFRAAGGIIEGLGWLGDWFVNMVVALRYGVCYVPEVLAFLRTRGDSYSALMLRDRKLHWRPFEYWLALMSEGNYADVALAMQEAGILPEYRLRTLVWLLQDETGRKFLSAKIVRRTISRSAWGCLRPLAPIWLRHQLRKSLAT